MQQANCQRREFQRFAQEIGEGKFLLRRALALQPRFDVFGCKIRPQTDVQHGRAIAHDSLAQKRRQGIDGAAFDPPLDDDGVASDRLAREGEAAALDRHAGEAFAKKA